MKKSRKFLIGFLIAFACAALLIVCAVITRNQSTQMQAALSNVDVCAVYLGEATSYDGSVPTGYKPICYVLDVENHSQYTMENIMMQSIDVYPNTISVEPDAYGEGVIQLSPSESDASMPIALFVPENLTDDEIIKSLSQNDLHILFQVDKKDYTLPVSKWRKGTKKEYQQYVIPGYFDSPAQTPDGFLK
mgnify:CR=1 FL=1